MRSLLVLRLPRGPAVDTRTAILDVKTHYWRDPRYRNEITSDDIYHAVLDSGVRSPSEFEVLLTERHSGSIK
jgi:hypothetical protein